MIRTKIDPKGLTCIGFTDIAYQEFEIYADKIGNEWLVPYGKWDKAIPIVIHKYENTITKKAKQFCHEHLENGTCTAECDCCEFLKKGAMYE